MYGEPFDIPAPDRLVLVSWFEGGEIFRSGCCYERGRGRIFYFRPGHETHPTYFDPNVRRVIANAVRWAAAGARPTADHGRATGPSRWSRSGPAEGLRRRRAASPGAAAPSVERDDLVADRDLAVGQDPGAQPGAVHERLEDGLADEVRQVLARLAEPRALALDAADAEPPADERVDVDPAGEDVAAALGGAQRDALDGREPVQLLRRDQRDLAIDLRDRRSSARSPPRTDRPRGRRRRWPEPAPARASVRCLRRSRGSPRPARSRWDGRDRWRPRAARSRARG